MIITFKQLKINAKRENYNSKNKPARHHVTIHHQWIQFPALEHAHLIQIQYKVIHNPRAQLYKSVV